MHVRERRRISGRVRLRPFGKGGQEGFAPDLRRQEQIPLDPPFQKGEESK